jgi:cold shock CspA family protein
MAESEKATGTIIWFDEKKACGFIRPDDGSPDIFVRLPLSRLATRPFVPGQRVHFELVGYDRGQAVIVS